MANGNTKNPTAPCPECRVGPFERNHFFTGKLMTARDFSDETRYHSERMLHHNSRLHGWGVVCGLKVQPHDNPACRDRYVLIEPGTALDCCGNEILVTETVTVELAKLPAIADLIKKKDTDPHRLQLCLSYKECPTEEVPVLYDECGCDDSRCAPNRILSSFEVDAILDAGRRPRRFALPGLSYVSTINPPHAIGAALHEATRRLYAISSDQNSVYQLDSESAMVVATAGLKYPPITLAVSNKGDRLYVVTDTGKKRQLVVLDTAQLGASPVNTVDLPNASQGAIYLAVASDNHLFSLAGESGELDLWPAEVDQKNSKPQPASLTAGTGLAGLAISSDAKTVYTVDGTNNQIVVVTVAGGKVLKAGTPIDLPPNSQPSNLALVRSTATDKLAVVSAAQKNLLLVDPAKKTSLGTAGLDNAPVAVAVSEGGHWGYVLEADSQKSFVQPVDLSGLQQAAAQVTADGVPVGDNSRALIATPGGGRLYVSSEGDTSQTASGGLDVIDIDATHCRELLWSGLEGCPDCDTANCVVLATVEGYSPGFTVEAQTDPAADPIADRTASVARIDNREGRKILPSTETLTEVIECLLERGCDGGGGAGAQGPPGSPGTGATVVVEPAGANCPYGGIKVTDGSGQVSYVCNGKPGVNGMPGAGATAVSEPPGANCPYGGIKVTDGSGQVSYVCNGKPGTDGKDGAGLERGLIQIKALSWRHDETSFPPIRVTRLDPKAQAAPGVVIGFTAVVTVGNPSDQPRIPHAINSFHVFQVFMIRRQNSTVERTQLAGTILPVKFTEHAGLIDSAQEVSGDYAPGAAFIFEEGEAALKILSSDPATEVWIRLQGDFVVDKAGKKAIDAEFVRAQLPTGDRPSGSPLGIQGGQFESWFRVHDTTKKG